MQKHKKADWLIMALIAIFYIFGALQLANPETRTLYTGMTPWVLLFSVLFLGLYDKTPKRSGLLLFSLIVAVLSFGVEVWGVATGDVFGSYSYGSELGVKIAETPLLIGLNWVLLLYLSAAISSFLPRNILSWIILPSILMVGYDMVMEQVAPRMDMWSWGGDVIPVQNYLVWGVLALLFHTLRYVMNITVRNRMALFLFTIQVLFFLIILIA
ncbi:carotenoid biosynthesis protein [Porphyromonas canoris]|uniref:carotenoid biosynthesis protein n=1 Tax=Porphyromonas canoris TaxID=36875 RepID=UPI0009E1E3FE|nr:carotenoid biosynthesis protein [Porphyromonas canoris]